jgi:hypothetical protein
MSALLQNTTKVLDAAWAAAMGALDDGTLTSGRAQGYKATSAVSGVAIYATTYTPIGTNAQRSVKSSNANDTAAGTGARQVRLNYLTAAFEYKSEIITLNGVTDVDTVAMDIAYVESMQVVSVGSGGGNAGNITLHSNTSGSGTTIGTIATSDNQTFWAHHYVPAGVTCYILNMTVGATVVAGQTNLNAINLGIANSPQLQIGMTLMHAAANSWDHDFRIPLAIPEKSLIWLVERPVAATASTAIAGFEYIQF